jgi:TonB family protein
LFAAVLLIAQPALAAGQASKAEHDRQISEIVFQNYPARALAAGEEGPVFFTVTLDKDAHPTSCQVTHGSGFPLLDTETCDLIVQHAVFNSARDANGHLVRQTTEGVVNWTLPGHTPAPISVAPAAVAAAKTTEPQVCKKNIRIGTVASVERTCMTPSEWAKQSDEQKQTYDELQGRKGSSNCMSDGAC